MTASCVATEGGSVAERLGVAESYLGSIDAMTGPNRRTLDQENSFFGRQPKPG